MQKYKSFFIRGFFKGMFLVPLIGLGIHFTGDRNERFSKYTGHQTRILADYSLRNRFESMYSFFTPDAHKCYHRLYDHDVNDTGFCVEEQYYLASPWATYPASLMFGALGGALAVRKQQKRRHEELLKLRARRR